MLVDVVVTETIDITLLCEDKVIERPESFDMSFTLLTQSTIEIMYIPLITEASINIEDTTGRHRNNIATFSCSGKDNTQIFFHFRISCWVYE